MGEVLNGKYIVKAAEQDKGGRPQYKVCLYGSYPRVPKLFEQCATLHGNEEVLVRCVGIKNNTDDDASTWLLSTYNEPVR